MMQVEIGRTNCHVCNNYDVTVVRIVGDDSLLVCICLPCSKELAKTWLSFTGEKTFSVKTPGCGDPLVELRDREKWRLKRVSSNGPATPPEEDEMETIYGTGH